MPRRARRLSDTKVYHVMVRGNERRNIFLDDEDRERFIDTLRYKQEEKTFSYFAYCLMSNHVHLIVDEGEEVISKIMQRINGSYAYYFNKKHQRSGHLFQDRFKSEVIEKDRYLLAAIRYVHNNPIKAGMIKNIEEYRWSSYREIISNTPSKAIVDKERILSLFADEKELALQAFIEFSSEIAHENFIDVDEVDNIGKTINGKKEAEEFLREYLKTHSKVATKVQELEKTLLNELIIELKSKSNLTIRELAELLNINRNTIQRAN